MKYIVTYQVNKENDLWKTTEFTDFNKSQNYYKRLKQQDKLVYLSRTPPDESDIPVLPRYCEENYKFKQGGNLWEDYSRSSVYQMSEDEINKAIKECVEILNKNATLNFVNKSNGNTLIIAERSLFGHYSVYIAEGYKECPICPSPLGYK